jgi:hypothetical protein
MKKLMRDPDLEALVRELNEGTAGSDLRFRLRLPKNSSDPAPATAESENRRSDPIGLEKLLIEAARRGASDLLLVAGVPPVLRVGGG